MRRRGFFYLDAASSLAFVILVFIVVVWALPLLEDVLSGWALPFVTKLFWTLRG